MLCPIGVLRNSAPLNHTEPFWCTQTLTEIITQSICCKYSPQLNTLASWLSQELPYSLQFFQFFVVFRWLGCCTSSLSRLSSRLGWRVQKQQKLNSPELLDLK